MSKAIVYKGEKREEIQFESPCLLSDIIKIKNHAFEMPCGGRGTCLKCRVKAKGNLSESGGEFCLACQTYALGDVEIYLDENKAQIKSENEKSSEEFGFAVDIGTTTVEIELYDLKTEKCLSKVQMINPQISFGSDVISRITAWLDGKGDALQACIVESLNLGFEMLTKEAEVSLEKIKKIVISANTAEMYFLTNENSSSIAAYPFKNEDFFGRFDDKLKDLLNCKNAEVFLTRAVSAFIGGDISSGLYASEIFDDYINVRNTKKLFIDIGTNGETVLYNNGKLVCTSAAAGPAFEGAGVSHGMLAKNGAIDTVKLNGFQIDYTVIGNEKPIGICGSGLVDAVSVMLEAGIISESGEISEEGHNFVNDLTFEDNVLSLNIGGVSVTQNDIRQVQLAKSAICSAVEALLNNQNLKAEDLDKVIVAGAFGKHIDFSSAEKIGLIPRGFKDKSEFLGNSSLLGAVKILLDDNTDLIEKMCGEIETLLLAKDEYFNRCFIENMAFSIDK